MAAYLFYSKIEKEHETTSSILHPRVEIGPHVRWQAAIQTMLLYFLFSFGAFSAQCFSIITFIQRKPFDLLIFTHIISLFLIKPYS